MRWLAIQFLVNINAKLARLTFLYFKSVIHQLIISFFQNEGIFVELDELDKVTHA